MKIYKRNKERKKKKIYIKNFYMIIVEQGQFIHPISKIIAQLSLLSGCIKVAVNELHVDSCIEFKGDIQYCSIHTIENT
jgi:hypothetical protein